MPATASAAASPRKSSSTLLRLSPSARSVPISCAPRDHRDRDGVVDEEQPDDQRDPRQRREVGVERRQHGLDLLAAPRRPLRRHACRQPRRDRRRDSRSQVGAFGQQHVEAIDAAQAIERQLRRGNVHQHEVAVEHARRPFVLQDAAHHERSARDRRSSAAARCRACSCGRVASFSVITTDCGLVRICEELLRIEVSRTVGLLACWPVGLLYLQQLVIAKRLVAQDVDAEDLHRLHRAGATTASRRRRSCAALPSITGLTMP